MSRASPLPGALAAVLLGIGGAPASAAEAVVGARLDSLATSNAYFDVTREWDLVLRPSLELGVDFAGYWSAGYNGELNYYSQHADLLSHWHEVYLFANPAWGEQGQHEVALELRGQWLANQSTYSAVDVVLPSAVVKAAVEPVSWLRWRASVEAGYRAHYRDDTSSSLDVKAETSLAFTLPSRTTLTPRVTGGVRRYSTPVPMAGGGTDPADFLLEVGLDVAQALWKNAGLQLGAALLPHVSNNALVANKVLLEQFNYLGEDFLFSGHRARAAVKQVLGGLTVEASFLYEQRDFDGWPAIDDQGVLTGEQRHDTRFTPHLQLRYATSVGSRALQDLSVEAGYSYTRQISNNALYDTDVHLVALALQGGW